MTKRKSDYVAFEKFVKYVRKRKIQSGREYRTLYESGHIPKSLYPKIPSEYYASKRKFKKPNTKLWSFKRARKYIRKLELSGREGGKNMYEIKHKKHSKKHRKNLVHNNRYRKFKSFEKIKPKLPSGFPKGPQMVYRKDWKGWNDFLGMRRASFEEARSIIRLAKIKNLNAWDKWKSSKQHLGRIGFAIKKIDDIRIGVPHTPAAAYKEWTDWGDFLGTGRIASKKRKFRPFKSARRYARSLKLKNGQEWKKLSKRGKLPYDIPADPKVVYGEDYPARKRTTTKGIELLNNWKGWADWLGCKPGLSNRRKISHKESVTRAKKGWANRKKKGNTRWAKDDPRRKAVYKRIKKVKRHDSK